MTPPPAPTADNTQDRENHTIVPTPTNPAPEMAPPPPPAPPTAPVARRSWHQRTWVRRTASLSAVFFVGVMVGTSGAETKTETVTKTKTVEVAGTIPQAEINKYKAQGRQEGKATAEADIEARLDRAEAKGRDDQKREDQAAADKALQDAAAAAAKAEVGPGTLIVGTDIQPGRYQTTAGGDILDSVYWARLSSLDGGGGVDNIIDNGNATGLTTIEIQPTDVAFETTGTWTKIG